MVASVKHGLDWGEKIHSFGLLPVGRCMRLHHTHNTKLGTGQAQIKIRNSPPRLLLLLLLLLSRDLSDGGSVPWNLLSLIIILLRFPGSRPRFYE